MRWLELKYKMYTTDNILVEDKTKESVIIPIGKGIFAKSIEEKIEMAEIGKSYNFLLVKPYGERREDLIFIVPKEEFIKRNINPYPGLVVSIDNKIGVIRGVNANRVIVDFNHPLADKDIILTFEVIREVNDINEKIVGLLSFIYKIPRDKIRVEISEKNIKINFNGIDVPKTYKEVLMKYIDEIKDYNIE